MNSNFDKKILEVYEKFENGEISGDEANLTIRLYTEMKSKEEYHRRKLLEGDKYPFKIDYGKDTDSNYIAKAREKLTKANKINTKAPTNSVFAIAMGKDSSSVNKNKLDPDEIERVASQIKKKDYETKSGTRSNGIINIGKDDNGKNIKSRLNISNDNTNHTNKGYEYINLNTNDLRKNKVKDLNVKLSHEIGHHSKNNTTIPQSVTDLINNILGNAEEKVIKGNKHTDKSELIADYNTVKRVGKDAALHTLYKSAKEMHRNPGSNTHEGIDQDIKLRAQFIKSLKKEDLE